jgi:hypothetical protein
MGMSGTELGEEHGSKGEEEGLEQDIMDGTISVKVKGVSGMEDGV